MQIKDTRDLESKSKSAQDAWVDQKRPPVKSVACSEHRTQHFGPDLWAAWSCGGVAVPPCFARYSQAWMMSLANVSIKAWFRWGRTTIRRLFSSCASGGIAYAESTQPRSRTFADTSNSLKFFTFLSRVRATTGIRCVSFITTKNPDSTRRCRK